MTEEEEEGPNWASSNVSPSNGGVNDLIIDDDDDDDFRQIQTSLF